MAVASMLFGLAELTHTIREQPHFEAHADNLTKTLSALLAQSMVLAGETVSDGGPEGSDGEPGTGASDASTKGRLPSTAPNPLALEGSALGWGQLPGSSFAEGAVLTFGVVGFEPLFQDEAYGLPAQVTAYLQYDEDAGLLLFWQTEMMTDEQSSEETRTLLLSPLVTGLEYLFYDPEADSWERFAYDERFDQEQQGLPDFLALEFTSPDGRTLSRKLLLPSGDLSPPRP